MCLSYNYIDRKTYTNYGNSMNANSKINTLLLETPSLMTITVNLHLLTIQFEKIII